APRYFTTLNAVAEATSTADRPRRDGSGRTTTSIGGRLFRGSGERRDSRPAGYFSRKRLTMGKRQSRPKARGVILTPIGPCRRLYSAASIMRTTLLTIAGSKPWAIRSATPRLSSTVAARWAGGAWAGGSVSW